MRSRSEAGLPSLPQSPPTPVESRLDDRLLASGQQKDPPSPDVPVVMLVDDDEDSLAMYAFALVAMGFQPVTARTADEAFRRACELVPRVTVADVMLPGSSGLDLVRRLRDDPRTNETAIIVLTGHSGASLRQEAEASCDRFLLKPCLPDTLALEIRDVLAVRNGLSTERADR